MEAVKHEASTRFYEFGPFLVDTEQSVLLREGEVVPIGLKAFELLLFLIRHRGQVVKKDEILKEVWSDTVVEENNLARHISTLRKILDEHPNDPQYILTIPGRGYRFAITVRELGSDGSALSLPAPSEANGHTINGMQAALSQPVATDEIPWTSEHTDHHARRSRSLWFAALLSVTVATSALLVYLFRQGARVEPQQQHKLWQLTFDPGLESEPSWSPDGNLIVYSADTSNNFDIWVRPVGEGNPVRVTASPAHDWQPDWAPKGNRLVFRSERDGGGLYIVPVLGGNERKVSDFGYRPRWSPDGTHILFTSILRTVMEVPKLYVVGLDGQAPREALAGFLPEFRSPHVAWHPDGNRISVWGIYRQQW